MPLRIHTLLLIAFTAFAHALFSQNVVDVPDFVPDAPDAFFEKVSVDGEMYFRNEDNGVLVTERYHNFLCIPFYEDPDSVQRVDIDEDEYWVTSKVNPYNDVVVPTPFMVQFEKKKFTAPVDGEMVVTSRFGRRRRGPHKGIDIDLVTGDFVRSVLPGKVRFVGYSRGHGKTVVVRHANDIETVYAHLSGYSVKVEDDVTEGQIIGFGGNTGNSRGSHLHLEVRYKGVCIHPEYVFDFETMTIRDQQLWVCDNWKNPSAHSSYRKSHVEPLTTQHEALVYQSKAPKFHKVRKGDTLSKIGRDYSMSIYELCSLNSIRKTSVLKVGQLIKIR